MAFKGKLLLEDSEYKVLSCDYSFCRDVDAKGRPKSNVYGGTINVTVESNDDTDIVAQLMEQTKPISGSVAFHKGGDAAKMKELSWKNGYIMQYSKNFDMTSEEPMTICFEISAETITMGSATVDHKRPK